MTERMQQTYDNRYFAHRTDFPRFDYRTFFTNKMDGLSPDFPDEYV